MKAKRNGKCMCGERFQAGAEIYWDPTTRLVTICPACVQPYYLETASINAGGSVREIRVFSRMRERFCGSMRKHGETIHAYKGGGLELTTENQGEAIEWLLG